MTFIDITCMSERSEEVIIETFPRRNDTPFFTTRSCRLMVQCESCDDWLHLSLKQHLMFGFVQTARSKQSKS